MIVWFKIYANKFMCLQFFFFLEIVEIENKQKYIFYEFYLKNV